LTAGDVNPGGPPDIHADEPLTELNAATDTAGAALLIVRRISSDVHTWEPAVAPAELKQAALAPA